MNREQAYRFAPVNHINRIYKSKAFTETLFWTAIFIAMIGGMLAKAFHDNFYNQRFEFTLTKDMFIPLLISPIVFGGIYGIIQHTPKNVGTFIFAFQNGFFWKAIFGGSPDAYPQ